MAVKQLSIYVENRKGSLAEIAKVLADEKIDLRSISVADTEEYGILRLLTTDSLKGAEVLQKAGFRASVKDVVAVYVPDEVGGLARILNILDEAEINLEYMYSVIQRSENCACMVLRVSDNNKAEEVLSKNGFSLATESSMKGK